MWSDETKIELWRKKKDEYPKNTIPTVKHGAGNLGRWVVSSSMTTTETHS